jgi:hypothetical protein
MCHPENLPSRSFRVGCNQCCTRDILVVRRRIWRSPRQSSDDITQRFGCKRFVTSCVPGKGTRVTRAGSAVGIGLSVLGFGMLVVLVWTEFKADDFGRLVTSVLTFAMAAGYASLIALAMVQPKYRNIVNSAFGLAAVLSVLFVGAIWAESRGDFMLRLMGIISILLAAATVSIPVLHRLNRSEISDAESIA